MVYAHLYKESSMFGGGVATRGWRVCVWWSQLLGLFMEFLKLLGGTVVRRGSQLAHRSGSELQSLVSGSDEGCVV
ncbi:hypothetical protein YC2023_117419 [Brassica napus]